MSLLRRFAIFLWAMPLMYLLLVGRAAQVSLGAAVGVALLLAGVGLVWSAVGGRYGWHWQATPLDGGMAAVFFALILSAIFSLDPSRSWRMVWNWSACLLAFYMAVLFLRTITPRPEPIVAIYLIVLGMMTLAAYGQLVVWGVAWYRAFGLSLGIPRPPRLAGLSLGPNTLAVLLNFGLLLGWGLWEGQQRPRWGWLALLFFLPVLLFTGSRSGWLGLLVGLAVAVVGWWWRQAGGRIKGHDLGRLAAILGGVGLALGGLLIWLRPDTLRMGSGFSILYRGEFWAIAWRTWQTHPWVGSGLDTFGSFFMLENQASPPQFPFRAAHSWWMSLLAETGVVGLGAAVSCWFLLGRALWAQKQPAHWSPLRLGVLAALAAFTVHATFDTPDPPVLFLAAICLAILLTSGGDDVPARGARPWLAAWPVFVWLALLLGGAVVYPAWQRYEAGVVAAEAGEWELSAAYFTAAQARLPYTDTGIALAQGLAYGVLAADQPAYLPQATAAYERLITHEPGWPTNYANLAALYWQAGERDKALAHMAQAQAIAPNVPLYALNAGLWQGVVGNETAAPPPASAALLTGDWATAEQIYTAALAQNPRDGAARTGLGLVSLWTGDETAAHHWFTQAALLQDSNALFWLALLDDPTAAFLIQFRQHNTFGLGRSNVHIYPTTLLNRPSLPLDLLPQLQCLSLEGALGQQIALLQVWQTPPNPLISPLQAAETHGLVPCSAPP